MMIVIIGKPGGRKIWEPVEGYIDEGENVILSDRDWAVLLPFLVPGAELLAFDKLSTTRYTETVLILNTYF